MSLEHVCWIGGGTGAGKTTAARAVVARYGLRAFHVDAFWYAHDARLGEPELSADERWLVPTPAEQAAAFLHRSRRALALVLEDLVALPAEPGIVVEGPQIVPDGLPAGARAVFLVPTADFQRRILEQRPMPSSDPALALRNRLVKDRLYADRIAALARSCGFATIAVDGTRDIVAEVERALGPFPPPSGDLAAARRWENEAVGANLRAWWASDEGAGVTAPRFPFVCECGCIGCGERVELGLDEFEAASAVRAPRH